MDEPLQSAIPKISRGENYRGLPWIILDYPAVFSKKDVFALRSFFWWGNFFSIYLHISGRYLAQFQKCIIEHLKNEPGEFFLLVNEDPWQHHFEEATYKRISVMERGYIDSFVHSVTHLKLALRFDLDNWENIPAELEKGYAAISRLLGADTMK